MGGSLVYYANMPPGASLVADLYLGTSSSALSLTTTTTFGSTPGEWIPTQVAVPGIPGGTTLFVKIQVRNAAFAAEGTWTPDFVPPDVYWGFSVEFPFTLGSSITYPSIVAAPSPWPPGPYPIPGGGGALGAIPVGYVPEPSVLALIGFGAMATLFNRRERRERRRAVTVNNAN
jgi:PEP-CTERM motif